MIKEKFLPWTFKFYKNNTWETLLCSDQEKKSLIKIMSAYLRKGIISEFYFYKNSRNIFQRTKKALQKFFDI